MKTITLVLVLFAAGCTTLTGQKPTGSSGRYCKPTESCWPTPAQWNDLATKLTGKLERVTSPIRDGAKNPFALEEQAGVTQGRGWFEAWTPTLSAYSVAAENANDVAIAINFARSHRLRIAVKGTGHDYLGRSSAPDSLLIWTHKMRSISMVDAFVPNGCANMAALPAVTLEAGTRWLEAYEEVIGRHQRYVQGGGCTSVGAAGGFLQGGGFGSWSKKYGVAAASLLEAEVVTADGTVRIANACQNSDLFWALKGGGGGTFGVVTKVTLLTHPLPNYFGVIAGEIKAKTDSSFKALLREFLRFYHEELDNEHWGEQIRIHADNSIGVNLVFAGLSAAEAKTVWKPMVQWMESNKTEAKLNFIEIPGDKMWNYEYLDAHFKGALKSDSAPGKAQRYWWWAGDGEQVNGFLAAYKSRWVSQSLFANENRDKFVQALFDASRFWSVALHFNKGQAAATKDAIERGRSTAMNPKVFDASGLIIIASDAEPSKAQAARKGVDAATAKIDSVLPYIASYANEADYFESDWPASFWGENYSRLLDIKKKYDPSGVFYCHHCVGSEL